MVVMMMVSLLVCPPEDVVMIDYYYCFRGGSPSLAEARQRERRLEPTLTPRGHSYYYVLRTIYADVARLVLLQRGWLPFTRFG